MIYIFYNPKSGDKKGKIEAEKLKKSLNEECVLADITEYNDSSDFFDSLSESDRIIICGGDGTLHHFINLHSPENIKAEISYFPFGSGNDFANDVNLTKETYSNSIKNYLIDLPTVILNGKTYKFLNNVGFGLDGYACHMGEIQKAKNDKPINYTTIAIRGILFDFKPLNATVTVDGVTKEYKKVWLAPTLKGRYFGGGMMATPNQNRLDPEKKLSVLVLHDTGKVKLLQILPKVFNGTHIKHKKKVEIITGNEITVTFDRPSTIQIDGEPIPNILTYSAKI